jgi:hypothetical protein
MSTPNGDPDHPWTQPGDSTGAAPAPPPPPSGYGTPSSSSYGKYGQGTAEPTPPPAPPAAAAPPQWGQPAPGQPQWGQPGYNAPTRNGPAPGDPTTVQPTRTLGLATIGFSVLFALSTLAAAAFAPNQHQFLKDTFDAAANGTEPPTAATGASNITSSLLLLVEIGVWVTVCLWLTRIRQNVVVKGQYNRRRSEVWLWLGWVIPVVNFWFPLQIVTDAVRSTAAAAGVRPIRTGFWWAAWLASLLASLVATATTLLPPDQTLHRSLVAVDVLVTVVALALWLRIVLWLGRYHDASAATTTSSWLP